MRRGLPGVLGLLAVAAIVAIEVQALREGGILAGPLRISLYLLASSIVSFDLIDLLVRTYFRRRYSLPTRTDRVPATSCPLEIGEFSPYQMRLHLRPWAIVASVHNLGDGLEGFLGGLEPFAKRLRVIDDASSDDTVARLAAAGVDHVRSDVNRLKPGALRQLLSGLPPEIETVVVVDPDARLIGSFEDNLHDLERVLFEFQRSGMDALCPRLQIREDGWLARFQELEYDLAFALGRKSMADRSITSGIAVYRRQSLERALSRHTLSVYAEDLENALLLLASGGGIYYDGRLVFETEGKRRISEWFSQRVGWYHGLLKVVTERRSEILRITGRRAVLVYQFLIYIGLFTVALHPLKLAGLALIVLALLNGVDNVSGLHAIPDGPATEPAYFLLAFAKYLVVILAGLFLAVPRNRRLRLLPVAPLYFFYALAHIVPVTVGYLNWIGQRWLGRKLYRDHYDNGARLEAP